MTVLNRGNGEVVAAAFDTVNQLIDRLDQIADRADRFLEREQLRYVSGQATVPGGDTVAVLEFPLPPGVDWIIERIATTAGTGPLAIYLDEAQPQNLLEFRSGPQIDAWGPENRVHVPDGRRIICRFYNQTAGQLCSINLRVRELAIGE